MANRCKCTTNRENGLTVERRFTTAGVHPFDEIEWELRDAIIGDPENPAFEQRGVEFPKTWSQNATNIVAQKYFRGQLGSPERETSVKQMIGRVAGTIAELGPRGRLLRLRRGRRRLRGRAHPHPPPPEGRLQLARSGSTSASRSTRSARPASSSRVEDTMESILDWNTKEGMIFRGGSGSGINLSNIRGSMEHLSKGGLASGPVSFMRGADAWAGTIKSGGKTRRAAKMVVLDVDHPDIEHFIWCKADEEKKAAALRDAGFDMSIDGEAFTSIQYQNANNSVRVTDEFMQAVEAGERLGPDRPRRRRADEDASTARDLMNQIADAAWRCADPGVQYDTTINRWHTCPESGRINASNPCSRVHARRRLGLQPRLAQPDEVPPRGRHASTPSDFEHAVDIVFLAQEIVVGAVELPDRGDRRERPRVPPARPRLRQPRRPADVRRPPLRLRRGPRRRRRDHRADDRPRLPQVGRDRRGDRARTTSTTRTASRTTGVMRMHRDAAYEIDDERDRGRAARRGPASLGRGGRARRGARLPQRAGDGAGPDRDDQLPDGLRHDRASSPTSRWSSSRSWSAAAR